MVRRAGWNFRQLRGHLFGFLFRNDRERTAVRTAFERQLLAVYDLAGVQLCRLNLSVAWRRNVRIQFGDAISLGYGRNVLLSLIPSHFDWRHVATGREFEFQRRGLREEEVVVAVDAYRIDLVGEPQIEELMGRVEDVCSPVT